MKIFDPLHRFTHLNALEAQVIDTLPLQRLRYIRQTGLNYLVYPGATHTRFEHSLGTMAVATRIFEHLMGTSDPKDYRDPSIPDFKDPKIYTYWRQILRFAALCHDIGHSPFSHAAESVLLPEGGHEKKTLELLESEYLLPYWVQVESLPGRSVVQDISRLALGEKRCPQWSFDSWTRILSDIVTDDFQGADRIDYLLRDAQYTGVAYGIVDYAQLVETCCMLTLSDGSACLGFVDSGLQAIESLLLARYFMHSRVYQHPSAKVYTYHLQEFLKKAGLRIQGGLDEYLRWTDNEILVELRAAAWDKGRLGHEDALRIQHRHLRYRYLPLTSKEAGASAKRADLMKKVEILQREFGEHVACDPRQWQLGIAEKLSTPFCLCANGEIQPLEKCSQIFSSIPSHVDPIFIFVPPEFEGEVKRRIEALN